MLELGSNFPEFKLEDQNGAVRTLSDFIGKWTVIYFYPKDNTSGCTLEAQEFASYFDTFSSLSASLIGVSKDSVKSHAGFSSKNSLPFTLLSDPESALQKEVGVWQLKKMAGREYMGTVRSTYLINPQGIVKFVWAKVKAKGHAEEVLKKLKELQE